MWELRLVKQGQEEPVKTIEMMSPNFSVITQGETKVQAIRNFDMLRKDEAHYYQQIYSQVVEKLVKIYPDYIGHINKDRIGFLVDDKWEPQEKATDNSAEYIDIKRTNKETKLYLGFDYEIVMKQHYLDKWDNAQLSAAILSTLLRVDRIKGTIKKYGEKFQSRLVATFGINYLDDDSMIPDVMENHIDLGDFEKAPKSNNGQICIDEIEKVTDDFNDGEVEQDDEYFVEDDEPENGENE